MQMTCSIPQHASFEKQQQSKEGTPQKQQSSTQNGSSIRTVQDDSHKNQGIKIKICKDKKQKELIKNLLQRICLIQKSQNQAKQKYQKCIFTLEKEIKTKELHNRKIEGQINCLSAQIKQGKKDLQIISNYLKKQTKKNENTSKNGINQTKDSSSANILKKSGQKRHINNSPLRLFKKSSYGN